MDIDLVHIKNIVNSASKAELLPRFNNVKYQYKTDGSIVTEADLAMQNRLGSALQKAYPSIALLGEEMSVKEQKQIVLSKQFWCLDPVDGSSNFAAGFPYFAVSLALIENGQVTLGIVYDPVRDECFSAQLNQGATLNNEPLRSRSFNLPLDRAVTLVDFKCLSSKLATQLVINRPYASQRSLGSIALELCWIASGRAHLYLHKNQQLWDYAAALLILNEVGAYTCTLAGKPLTANTLTPCSTIASLDEKLFSDWCAYLQETDA